jgi:TPR repeat protein
MNTSNGAGSRIKIIVFVLAGISLTGLALVYIRTNHNSNIAQKTDLTSSEMCIRGFMYANGVGVSQDFVLAMQWYRRAAEAGDAEANCYIGELYENGQGVSRDYRQAMGWYRKAADAGNPTAMEAIRARKRPSLRRRQPPNAPAERR